MSYQAQPIQLYNLSHSLSHSQLEKKSENKEENKDGKYLRREFSYTKFQQTMILPENVDQANISAKVDNGVLTIDVPKIPVEHLKSVEKEIVVQ